MPATFEILLATLLLCYNSTCQASPISIGMQDGVVLNAHPQGVNIYDSAQRGSFWLNTRVLDHFNPGNAYPSILPRQQLTRYCQGVRWEVLPNYQCCGRTVYNVVTEVCTPDGRIEVCTGPAAAGSCSSHNNELLCQGVPWHVPLNYQCCGSAVFNLTSELCSSDGVIISREFASPSKIPPLPNNFLHCQGVRWMVPVNYQCCGTSVYNTYRQICSLNGTIEPNSASETTSTVGARTETTTTSSSARKYALRCREVNWLVPLNYKCCGSSVYDITRQVCSDRNIIEPITPVKSTTTAPSTPSYPTSLYCNGVEHQISPTDGISFGCCGENTYNVQTETCTASETTTASSASTTVVPISLVCNGAQFWIPSTVEMDYGCCGQELYNIQNGTCQTEVPPSATTPAPGTGVGPIFLVCEGAEHFVSAAERTIYGCCGRNLYNFQTDNCPSNPTFQTTTPTTPSAAAVSIVCEGVQHWIPGNEREQFGCCGHDVYNILNDTCDLRVFPNRGTRGLSCLPGYICCEKYPPSRNFNNRLKCCPGLGAYDTSDRPCPRVINNISLVRSVLLSCNGVNHWMSINTRMSTGCCGTKTYNFRFQKCHLP